MVLSCFIRCVYGIPRMVRYTRRRFLKKRAPRRRFARRRPMMRKKITNQIHRFIRWGQSGTSYSTTGPSLINALTSNQNLGYTFSLRNVVNVVDFTSLYDQYRINKVTIYMEPYWNTTAPANIGLSNNRKMRIVHDYNDNDLLSVENQYLEYSNCKSYNTVAHGTIKIVLYPKIAQVVENVGGTANGFNAVPSNKMWLNTVDDQILHFGIKAFIPGFITSTDQPLLNVRVKFDLSFKNSK